MLQLTEKGTEPELDSARINETINNFQQIITSAADKSFGIPRLQKIRKRPIIGREKNVKSPCKRVITLSIKQTASHKRKLNRVQKETR